MKKTKIFLSIFLSIILAFQVSFFASASSINNDLSSSTDVLESSLQQYLELDGVVEDNRVAIPDNESYLLPKTTRSNASSVDLSTSRFFPPVGDQHNIGNCTSWACVYYQFGYQVASRYSLDVSNNYNLFSPRWVHNIAKDNINNYNGGSSFENVYRVLASNGSVRYSEFPPTSVDVEGDDLINEYTLWYLNEEAMTNALQYRVSYYELLEFADINTVNTPITSYNSSCINNMKSFLSNGNVITISTDDTTWQKRRLTSQYNNSLNNQYVCIALKNDDSVDVGHALAVVGYDDNITYDLNNNGTIENFERGAFKIVNSWGDDALGHNNGFIWVMYDALNKVSNASNLNYTNRLPIFENYSYNVIGVKKYPCDVIAKVKLNHCDRTHVTLKLGVSSTESTVPDTTMLTMLKQKTSTNSINFSGTGNTYEDKTFVFDFGDLYALDTERSNCYIQITEKSSGAPTIVKRIELIDSTGKTIELDTVQKTVSSFASYRYKLGIVGDINNDTSITAEDATSIQKHLAGLTTLTSEDLLTADVDGNGIINSNDTTLIQKYVSGIIEEFPNGCVVLLE